MLVTSFVEISVFSRKMQRSVRFGEKGCGNDDWHPSGVKRRDHLYSLLERRCCQERPNRRRSHGALRLGRTPKDVPPPAKPLTLAENGNEKVEEGAPFSCVERERENEAPSSAAREKEDFRS